MASVSVQGDSPSKDSEVASSHDSSVCSKVNNEEDLEGYESVDSDDSKCSVTSRRKVGYRADLIGSFVDPQATDAIVSDQISNAGDSAHTSWTDEKHSSYLNSMEATFVQKMYDKEYCSLDVCGRSGHSSVTFEQDCVESHPFCFNKTQEAGGFTYEGSFRPCFIAPSVLASPWIQHFKSKQPVPVGQEKKKIQNLPASGAASNWNLCFPVHTRLDVNRNTRKASPFPDFQSAMKKRGVSCNIPDCRQSVTQCSGYGTSMQNVLAARLTKFKKIKCQQMLSQMDMKMEEQFLWQQRNKCYDAGPAIEEDHQKILQANNLPELIKIPKSDDKDAAETEFAKEKESIVMEYERELPRGTVNMLLPFKKVDQVVPFLKDGVTGEAGKSSMVPELLIEPFVSNGKDEPTSISKEANDLASPNKHVVVEQAEAGVQDEGEDGPGRDSTELRSVSKRTGSHTWTWGIQGPRHQLGGKIPRTQSKYLT